MNRPLHPGHTVFHSKPVACGGGGCLDSGDQGTTYELGVSLCVREASEAAADPAVEMWLLEPSRLRR